MSTQVSPLVRALNWLSDQWLYAHWTSQADYFENLYRWLRETSQSLVMQGYDAPFMESGPTEGLIRSAVTARSVRISAILQEGQETILDSLADSSPLVTLHRIEIPIPQGYTIFDGSRVAIWNSTRTTKYPPERDRGIWYRRRDEDDLGFAKDLNALFRRDESILIGR